MSERARSQTREMLAQPPQRQAAAPELQRRPAPGGAAHPAHVLQRVAGNQFVQRRLSAPGSGIAEPLRGTETTERSQRQPAASRLTVNRPGDPYEREAEAVAARVVGGGGGGPPANGSSPAPGGRVQRQGGGAPSVSAAAAATMRSPGAGQPLSPSIRSRVEPRLGADLSGVRVHGGASAAGAAASLQARAFTYGRDIFLGEGPSAGDAGLMAHEASHVVQQGAAPVRRAAEPAAVQRDVLDVGMDVVERLAPALAQLLRDIRRAGGVVPYLKDLLTGAIDALFGGLGEDSGALAGLFELFNSLVEAIGPILSALAAGDCQPLFDAVGQLSEAVQQMAGEAWDTLVGWFEPIGDFFSDLWDSFGAPIVDWISDAAGEVWDGIQQIASDIWDWTQPVRDTLTSAWEWVKEQLGIGGGEDSEDGLIQWVQDKASEAWDAILEALEPVIAPIRGVVDRVLEILPLDAILNLRETVQDWLQDAGSMVDTMGQEDGVAAQQTSLRDEILPAILESVEGLREGLVRAGEWIGAKIGGVVEQVATFVQALRNHPLVGHLAGVIQWVADGVSSLGQWAQQTVANLLVSVGEALVYLAGFVRPVLGVLERLVAVVGNVMGNLADLVTGGLWSAIPQCIVDPIKEFLIEHILSHIPIFSQLLEIPDIWSRVSEVALRILRQLFVDGNLFAAAWSFFSAMLELVGIPPELVTNILRKAIDAFGTILGDPVGFLMNLLRAVKEGFVQFFANIGTHLLSGVTGWLFGQMQEGGITPPADFSLGSILGLVLEILDITTERIFERMARHPRIGPERVAQLRRALDVVSGAWSFVATLVREGPGGLWRMLMARLSDLWQTVLDSVIGWVTNNIITSVTAKLLSMLDPTGIMAVVNSLIAIYRAIQSFMQYIREMLEIVNSVLDGIAGIAAGAIGQAASFLENALARAMPIAIGFLANQVGLGGLGRRIGEMVEGVRERVNGAIDWLIERAVRAGSALLQAGRAVGGAIREGVRGAVDWWRQRVRARQGREQHTLFFRGEGQSATTMIASVERPLDAYVNALEERLRSQADYETVYRPHIDQIRTHQDTIQGLKEGGQGMTQAAGETIRGELVAIAGELVHLPEMSAELQEDGTTEYTLDEEARNARPASEIAPDPAESRSFPARNGRMEDTEDGAGVTARLSIDPGGNAGRSATHTSRLLTDLLARRGVYVAGHLLNHHLYGDGTDPRIVTPMIQGANQDFKSDVEALLKRLVLRENKVVYYRVDANYPPSPRGPDPIPGEGYVANSFSFQVQEMTFDDAQFEEATDQEAVDALIRDKQIMDNWDESGPSHSVSPVRNNVRPYIGQPIGEAAVTLTREDTERQLTRAGLSPQLASKIYRILRDSGWFDDPGQSNDPLEAAVNLLVGSTRRGEQILTPEDIYELTNAAERGNIRGVERLEELVDLSSEEAINSLLREVGEH